MVELGQLDIYINVALLSSYLTAPRKGHLEAVYCIYRYLKAHIRSTMIFDDAYVQWNENDFPAYDWLDFYGDVQEEIPKNAPPPQGQPVQLNVFVMPITPEISLLVDHKQESFCISIRLLLFGTQNHRKLWRLQHLDPNLLRCALQPK